MFAAGVLSTVFFGRGNIGEAWRRELAHSEGEYGRHGDLGMLHIDIVMRAKAMTRLSYGRHRAPHRCVCANHAMPTVVLRWTSSERGRLRHLVILIGLH
jgi:hypothetical protein